MTPKVDLVILTRQVGPLHPDVEAGLRRQRGVQLAVHRVAGSTNAKDRCRWDAIARARNEGKMRGTAPWLMFLDDDVVLDQKCIATLVDELDRRPIYAALAADYIGEHRIGEIARHVSMGATLFRRAALDEVRFTWRGNKCECQCCCDDLRRMHWGIDYCRSAHARHLPKTEVNQSPNPRVGPGENSMVTCMCVTHNRIRLLRRSVQCFLNQTYRHRELVIVYQSDDERTRRFLTDLREPSILLVEVPAVPRLPLGSLRNISLQSGSGKYIATWDDDDWYSPTRLAQQMRAIRESGKRGCVLARLSLYDCQTKHAYVSGARPWENSIVVERAILPLYPDLARGSDTPVVGELIRRGELTLLGRPELYIHTYHSKNTWNRSHWEGILRRSQPLGAKTSRLVKAMLDDHTFSAAESQAFLTRTIRDAISEISAKTPVTAFR